MPFLDLPPMVFEVMVRAQVGQLGVDDLAAALAVDRAAILRCLADGLRLLRGSSALRAVR